MHRRLVEYHRDKLEALSRTHGKNMTAYVLDELKPRSALLSYWGAQATGYGGAIHSTRKGPLLDETDLAPAAMAPFGAAPVYVANEAFGALRTSNGDLGTHHGWAECSLVLAENVLADKFGLAPPAWINATVYDQYVRFHRAPAERARRKGWHQG